MTQTKTSRRPPNAPLVPAHLCRGGRIVQSLLRYSWLLVVLGLALGCRKSPRPQTAPSEPAAVPASLRLVVVSTLAGALEPCGCRKDMLGGLDHAAELVAASRRDVDDALVLSVGATFFLDPELGEQSRAQDLWKAQSIARGLKSLGLAALTPGVNDWAAGSSELSELLRLSGAEILAANLSLDLAAESASASRGSGASGDESTKPQASIAARGGAGGGARGHSGSAQLAGRFASEHVVRVGDFEVGLVGVVQFPDAPARAAVPNQVRIDQDVAGALARGVKALDARGAQIKVGLFSGDRGAALRAAERTPGLHVLVVGKARDAGEGNDAFKDPELVGKTLVVEAPNHLQAVTFVDLYVKDDNFEFADGSGLSHAAARASLQRSVDELEQRIATWRKSSSVRDEDVAARERDLQQMKARLAASSAKPPVPRGSYFEVETKPIVESSAVNSAVHAEIAAYYERVNEYNRRTFADKTPPPVEPGSAGYIGAAACGECHQEAVTFWEKTRHASAYEALSKEHKEFNLDCVSCHVTGYEQPGGSTVTHVDKLMNVQCEECHGPGSLHAKDGETGLIRLDPGKEFCSKCHHSPHVLDSWKAEVAWPKILGKGHGE